MKVLVATDGEAPSETAEGLFVRLGDRATVDVLAFGVATYAIDPNEPDRNVEDARRETKERVEGLAQRLEDAGFRVSSASAEGDPGAEIVRKVESDGVDVAVVGAGRHTWLRERLLGTTSSYVVHNSPSSVLLVKECDEREGRLKVLVATDGSEHAEHATRAFSRFVDPARVAVTVVAIAHPSVVTSRENVEAARALLDAEGIAAEIDVHVEGAPGPRLLELAEQGGYHLVVMGSRGLGPVRSALLGSVSDLVVRHARATFVARALP
jgi:nucleotide-binding universal stress UspA family protein